MTLIIDREKVVKSEEYKIIMDAISGVDYDESAQLLINSRDKYIKDAHLNELKHQADNAINRMYKIDRAFAVEYIKLMKYAAGVEYL